MRLFAVGVSHRTAPVELRECVDFARRGIDTAIAALTARNVTREAVVLSTCNRAEIYGSADSDEAAESCGRFISEYNGVAWDALAPVAVTTMSASTSAWAIELHGTACPPRSVASACAELNVRLASVTYFTACALRCVPVSFAISPAPRMRTCNPLRSRKILRARAIAA